MSSKPTSGQKVIADNRKARHDYEVLDTIEAGVALVGTEVKSLRSGTVTMGDAYVMLKGGEAFIIGMHVPVYAHGNIHNHEPTRERKLLLHRKELTQLETQTTRKGHTLIPLKLYFKEGRVKLLIGIARGKSGRDKRATISDRDAKRQVERDYKLRLR
jgi:SsrA-binding protein